MNQEVSKEGWGQDSRYSPIRLLGRGSYGDVWLVRDSVTDQEVTLKFLRVAPGDSRLLGLFKQEFEILSQIRHSHLCRVYDFGFQPDQERYYFTSEFCPGSHFLTAIADKPYSYLEECLAQVLSALDCVHSQGVVHFDIKGDNILVEEKDGRPLVKIVDFGVAARHRTIAEGWGAGTLPYMAPEILKGTGSVDHRVDLYSLGMLYLRALTGTFPFDTANNDAVSAWHLAGELSPETWSRCAAPRYFREIVEKLLRKKPSERFSSARVVLNFLNLATGGRYHDVEKGLAGMIPAHGPLVERTEGLDDLKKRFDTSSAVLTISGEEGLGKTRILEEMRHHAELREVPTLDIVCHWGEPVWPRLAAFLNLGGETSPAAGSPADILPGSGGQGPEWESRKMIDRVIAASKLRSFCLFLDDFHKADEETRGAILGLRERIRLVAGSTILNRFFILAAEVSDEAGDLPLGRISLEGVRQYIGLVLGENQKNDSAADLLHRYSGGLPLLMVEGLRFLAPYLYRDVSLEDLLPAPQVGLLYEKRLGSLTEGQREILEILALLFRPAGEVELESILEMDAGAVWAGLQAAIRQGLAATERSNAHLCASQALALSIVRAMGAERKQDLHRRISVGLERVGRAPAHELAFHMERGGRTTEAQRLYEEEAGRLDAAGYLGTASRLLFRAAKLASEDSPEWGPLMVRSIRWLLQTGNYQQAEEELERLKKEPSADFWEMRGVLAFRQRHFDEARKCFQEALALVPEGALTRRILLRNVAGNVEIQLGDLKRAEEIFWETLASERELDAAGRKAVPNNGLGLVLSLQGKTEEAVAFYEERLERLSNQKVHERIMLLNGMGFALLQGRRWGEGIRRLEEALGLVEKTESFGAIFTILGNLQLCMMKEARYADCLPVLRKAISYQERFGTVRDVAFNFLRLGGVYLRLNMLEAAAGCFQKGKTIAEGIRDLDLTGWFHIMEGCCDRESGKIEAARRLFESVPQGTGEEEASETADWARYFLADIAFQEGRFEECGDILKTILREGGDEEFRVRKQLLDAKLMVRREEYDRADAALRDLESRCRENGFEEARWEVVQASADAALASGRPTEAREWLRAAVEICDRLAAALPEEYRDRYLSQRDRRRLYKDWLPFREASLGLPQLIHLKRKPKKES